MTVKYLPVISEVTFLIVSMAFTISTVSLLTVLWTKGYRNFGFYSLGQFKKLTAVVFLTFAVLSLPALCRGAEVGTKDKGKDMEVLLKGFTRELAFVKSFSIGYPPQYDSDGRPVATEPLVPVSPKLVSERMPVLDGNTNKETVKDAFPAGVVQKEKDSEKPAQVIEPVGLLNIIQTPVGKEVNYEAVHDSRKIKKKSVRQERKKSPALGQKEGKWL